MTDEVVIQCPGFISANFHLSKDGTSLINYAQWRSLADLKAMLEKNAHHVKRCQELAESIDAKLELDVVYCAYPGGTSAARDR